MAHSKRYKVLVGSEVVYTGAWRTAEVVFDAILDAFKIAYPEGSLPNVVLAFDI